MTTRTELKLIGYTKNHDESWIRVAHESGNWVVQVWPLVEGSRHEHRYFGRSAFFASFDDAYELASRLEGLGKKNKIVMDEKPEGWSWLEGATTAPVGYRWAATGSLFWKTRGGKRYMHALIKEATR